MENIPDDLLKEMIEEEEMYHRGHGIFVNDRGQQFLPELDDIPCSCGHPDLVLYRSAINMGYARPRYVLCRNCNAKSVVAMTTEFAIANFKNFEHYYEEYDL